MPDVTVTSPESTPDGKPCGERGKLSASVESTLAAWHVQGLHLADPVRFALIQAMARRALRYDGTARAVIDARLAALVHDYRVLLFAHGRPDTAGIASAQAPTDQTSADAAQARGALGALVDALSGGAPSASAARASIPTAAQRTGRAAGKNPVPASGRKPRAQAAGPALPEIDLDTVTLSCAERPAAAHELQSVRRFRGTWSRLSAQERLRQTLAQVPPQAGPLNALHLLHRALVQMHDIAPDYLQHFVEHVDALLWLEQVQAATIAVPATARSGGAARKIAASRSKASRGR